MHVNTEVITYIIFKNWVQNEKKGTYESTQSTSIERYLVR